VDLYLEGKIFVQEDKEMLCFEKLEFFSLETGGGALPGA
jgi:hypothetical protein